MIFNQLEFFALFLPAVVLLFVAFPRARHVTLILASFIFYALSGPDHAAILLFVSTWTWVLCRDSRITGNGARLAAAILPALAALFYYKYFGFIGRNLGFGGDGSTLHFALFNNAIVPAGISFFTFHLVAYAIDRYRKTLETSPPFRDFLLFMCFFPHLVAGPILRFSDVSRALETLATYRIGATAVARFIGYVVVGLALKVLIADTLGSYIGQTTVDLDKIGIPAAIFVVFGYSFQIYFDFFGYSLIAIGLGTLFGFTFPKNFEDPYKSLDIRDFWRRWHMTLSFWIRDYLYLPLGGNQHYVRNILIVFGVCGLWHGAGWNFIVWGLAHGLLVAGYHATRNTWDRLPRLLRMGLTFTIVSLLWLLFLFDFDQLHRFAGAVLSNGMSGSDVSWEMWGALAIAALVCFVPNLKPVIENNLDPGWIRRNLVLGLVFALSVIFIDRSETFIYFRF